MVEGLFLTWPTTSCFVSVLFLVQTFSILSTAHISQLIFDRCPPLYPTQNSPPTPFPSWMKSALSLVVWLPLETSTVNTTSPARLFSSTCNYRGPLPHHKSRHTVQRNLLCHFSYYKILNIIKFSQHFSVNFVYFVRASVKVLKCHIVK